MLQGIVTWVDEPARLHAAKGEIARKYKWNQQHLLPSENELDVGQVEVDVGVGDLVAIGTLPQ